MSLLITSINYMDNMIERGRAIQILKNDKPVGWCTYLLGGWEDTKRFHEREFMSVVQDNDFGSMIYIDYIYCGVRWVREVRNSLCYALKSKHPEVKLFVWYRPTQKEDREMVWRADE